MRPVLRSSSAAVKMHSSNFYRNYSSPYKAPSKSANTYDASSNRSRSNLNELYDETWPLDEVIDKIDIKSDSEDDLSYSRGPTSHSWNHRGALHTPDRYSSRHASSDRVYSAFPSSSKPWSSARRYDLSPKRESHLETSNKWNKGSSYGKHSHRWTLHPTNWLPCRRQQQLLKRREHSRARGRVTQSA